LFRCSLFEFTFFLLFFFLAFTRRVDRNVKCRATLGLIGQLSHLNFLWKTWVNAGPNWPTLELKRSDELDPCKVLSAAPVRLLRSFTHANRFTRPLIRLVHLFEAHPAVSTVPQASSQLGVFLLALLKFVNSALNLDLESERLAILPNQTTRTATLGRCFLHIPPHKSTLGASDR